VTLGSHQKTVGDTQTWITPKWIIDALGPFDLDPCAADPRPWDCAEKNLTWGGLGMRWSGRVWLNPPFNRYEVADWVKSLADHGQGTALLHARTEAEWFEPIWQKARAILFLADRLYFHYPDGRRAQANSGAPACLIAFGAWDVNKLIKSKIAGALVTNWVMQP
jgi:DNA N-6-adenine-methyltransferase (Dam)